MNTSKLIELGKKAGHLRIYGGTYSEYVKAVAAIDVEAAWLQAQNPDKFWTAKDPKYQALTAKWAEDRKARAQKEKEMTQ